MSTKWDGPLTKLAEAMEARRAVAVTMDDGMLARKLGLILRSSFEDGYTRLNPNMTEQEVGLLDRVLEILPGETITRLQEEEAAREDDSFERRVAAHAAHMAATTPRAHGPALTPAQEAEAQRIRDQEWAEREAKRMQEARSTGGYRPLQRTAKMHMRSWGDR
jgi:hypothetical protein